MMIISVAVIGIVASIYIPEIRQFLGLDQTNESDLETEASCDFCYEVNLPDDWTGGLSLRSRPLNSQEMETVNQGWESPAAIAINEETLIETLDNGELVCMIATDDDYYEVQAMLNNTLTTGYICTKFDKEATLIDKCD